MSSPSAQVVFVPVRFTCERAGERTIAIQYIAVPAFSTIEDVRATARNVMADLLSGARTRFSTSLPASGGGATVCGFEILPILAIPR